MSQIAYGGLSPDEQIEAHTHQTMAEFLFFLGGKGVYCVDGENVELEKGVFRFR